MKKKYFYEVIQLAAAVNFEDITMARWNDPEWQENMLEVYETVADVLPETYEELSNDKERCEEWANLFADMACAYYEFEKQ